jgi:DNA mismatch endonuclease Vsr
MDKLTPEQRRKNMQAIKSKGSKIEDLLAKALFRTGLRYRRNVKDVFGCPDICVKKYKIAIFCDSEFWHGKDWEKRKFDFKSKQEFWIPKIERNIQRDIEVNQKLSEDGWVVLRFWGKEINKDLQGCLNKILHIIDETKRKN